LQWSERERVNSSGRPRTPLRPEPLAALLALAPTLPGPWHTSSANIAMEPVLVVAADVEWQLHVHAYAVRDHLANHRHVEVTVGLTLSTERRVGARSGRAPVVEWQRGVAERLAKLGYTGSWQRSPQGPFAHFSKVVRGVPAVRSAVRELQRVRF
jgi:hypothetical protein